MAKSEAMSSRVANLFRDDAGGWYYSTWKMFEETSHGAVFSVNVVRSDVTFYPGRIQDGCDSFQ